MLSELLLSLCMEAAKGSPLDGELIYAVVQAESSGDPRARNAKSDARGLLQLTPIAHEDVLNRIDKSIGPGDLYDPAYNLAVGVAYMEWLNKQFPKDLDNLLAAWNWGIGNVRRMGDSGTYPSETREFIRRVKSNLDAAYSEARRTANREASANERTSEDSERSGGVVSPAQRDVPYLRKDSRGVGANDAANDAERRVVSPARNDVRESFRFMELDEQGRVINYDRRAHIQSLRDDLDDYRFFGTTDRLYDRVRDTGLSDAVDDARFFGGGGNVGVSISDPQLRYGASVSSTGVVDFRAPLVYKNKVGFLPAVRFRLFE